MGGAMGYHLGWMKDDESQPPARKRAKFTPEERAKIAAATRATAAALTPEQKAARLAKFRATMAAKKIGQ